MLNDRYAADHANSLFAAVQAAGFGWKFGKWVIWQVGK
jgi:hypothetical protein